MARLDQEILEAKDSGAPVVKYHAWKDGLWSVPLQ